jgi:uncharacterized membrane protein
MIKILLIILLYFAFPLVIISMCRHWTILKKIGSIALAYGFGIILGTSGLLPAGSEAYKFALQGRLALPGNEAYELYEAGKIGQEDMYVNKIASAQDTLVNIMAPLAFPLLLFSLNVRRWLRFAKAGFLSMFLALISVIIIITSGYLLFRDSISDSWKVAGMLVGLYTGGTPNLVSLKVALGVDPDLFLMTSTYDIILGAITLIFILTLGPRVFRALLPPFKPHAETPGTEVVSDAESFEDFTGMLRKDKAGPLLKALGISVLIFAVSYGISFLFPASALTTVVILSITTLGILASLIPWVNRIEKTFELGMYFVLVFSFAIASMADLADFFNVGFLGLFLYVSYTYFGSMVLHFILSKIFGVNADDYLITTTALVYSPPFVPVVASALKNKDVIITGITVGIIGYVIGNYLGVVMGYFLKNL